MKTSISGSGPYGRKTHAGLALKGRQAPLGFTIVELIIVIVVIAILATISLVSYNHVQRQARNAQTIAGVQAYQKALIAYSARNLVYPNHYGACLGANYPSDQCWTGTNGNFNVSSTLDAQLAPYLDSIKPTVSTRPLQITSVDQRLGAAYMHYSESNVQIIYYLEGQNQQCIGGFTGGTEMQGTQCSLQLPPA